MKNKLKLSIVIPVYNEQERMRNCLEAIANQTKLPEKVIVVDNNSTDDTVIIAKSFSFVEVISEKKQGIVFARNAGFNKVKSDIIGRIDADTILPRDWVERVIRNFEVNPSTEAITGDCYFYDFPAPRLTKAVHHFFYYTLQNPLLRTQMLWGSNMAIRRSTWQQVRALCTDDEKEDIDLTIHLAKMQKSTRRDKKLLASVSMRRGKFDPKALFEYLRPWPNTYWRNGLRVRSIVIYGVLGFIYMILLPAAVLLQFSPLLYLLKNDQRVEDDGL